MAFDKELKLHGFYRSQSDSDGPSTIELHLHRRDCRRVFRPTHYGILPPTEDEPIGPSRYSQIGFSFQLLSEFRHQMWISIASLNFSLSLCSFLYLQITSFVIDFAAESRTRLCPSLILVADIKFVQKLYVPLELIQPRQLAASAFANENLILGTSMEEGPEVDSNGFVDETFILGGTTEGWGGAEVDSHTFLDETPILEIPAEVDEDNNAGMEMLKRIKRGKWVMGGGEEVNCSVCLEEFSEGEEVMTMECKHSYHLPRRMHTHLVDAKPDMPTLSATSLIDQSRRK